ncbi:hypothetical protein D1N53_23745, partial [Clostridioides difficile]
MTISSLIFASIIFSSISIVAEDSSYAFLPFPIPSLIAGVEAIIMFISIYVFSYGIGLMANVNNRMSLRTEEAISIS